MSFPKEDRNIRTKLGKTFPKSSTKITDLDDERFANAISLALHRAFAGTGSPVKIVMKQTGAAERTVKNWFQGKNGPNGKNLVSLMHNSDEILETMLMMAGKEDILAGKLLIDAREKLIEVFEIIDHLSENDAANNPPEN